MVLVFAPVWLVVAVQPVQGEKTIPNKIRPSILCGMDMFLGKGKILSKIGYLIVSRTIKSTVFQPKDMLTRLKTGYFSLLLW